MENQHGGQVTGPLDHWWTEAQLCDKFELKIHDGGRSPVISSWIRRGLKYALIGRRRYFFETYVDEFLREEAQRDKEEVLNSQRRKKKPVVETSSDEF